MFRHHPSDTIYIGNFSYPLAEFLIDEPGYALPSGFIGRTYDPGVKHSLFTSNTDVPQAMPWLEGNAYLAKESQYAAAYAARHPAPPPYVPGPVQTYVNQFAANLLLWAKLHKKLDDDRALFDWTTATATTIAANLRQQVKDIVAIVLNTAPPGVVTAFQNERVLQGSTTTPLTDANINVMTVAECRILINVARAAATQGIAITSANNDALDSG